MESLIPGPIAAALDLLVTLFVFIAGLGVAALAVMFVIDVTQKRDAVRRNYPVVGRFRSLFTRVCRHLSHASAQTK